MALKLNCPSCASTFGLPDVRRGRQAFCPKCGASLVVTGAGVAKLGERHGSPARGFPWLLLALALVLMVSVIIVGYFAMRRHDQPQGQLVAKSDDGPKPNKNKERDHVLVQPDPAPKPKDLPKENDTPKKTPDPEVNPPVEVKSEKPQPLNVKLIKTLGPMTYSIIRLAFSSDDKTLAAAGWEITKDNRVDAGGANLWDVGSGKETAALNEQNAQVCDPTFSPDGKTLTLGTWTGPAGNTRYDVKVWDLAQAKYGKTIFTDKQSQDDDFRVICLSPDGKIVASGNMNNPRPTQLLSTASGATVSTLKETGYPSAMIFSPDSKKLASISWTNEGKNVTNHVTLWDVASGSKLSTFTADPNNQVRAVAISPDSKTLAAIEVVEKTATVVYWDVAGGKKLSSFPVDGGVSLAISPDKKMLAVGSAAGVHLYDLANGKCLATLHEEGGSRPLQL